MAILTSLISRHAILFSLLWLVTTIVPIISKGSDCKLSAVPGDASKYAVKLWGKTVKRSCTRGQFVRKMCRCVVENGTTPPEGIEGGEFTTIKDVPWTLAMDGIPANSQKCFTAAMKKKPPEGIEGGEFTTIKDVPWTLAMDGIPANSQDQKRFIYCAAALIDVSWAVTAGHCVDSQALDEFRRIQVVGGSSTNPASPNAARTSFTVHIDPRTAKNLKNPLTGYAIELAADFALLELHKPFILSDSIKPIPPALDTATYFYKYCQTSGWGCPGDKPDHSSQAQFVKRLYMRPLPRDDRRCWSTNLPRQGELCALDYDVTSVFDCDNEVTAHRFGIPCSGDSGGPLVCFYNNWNPVLLGVLSGSSGIRGCRATYAALPIFKNFIDATKRDFDPNRVG